MSENMLVLCNRGFLKDTGASKLDFCEHYVFEKQTWVNFDSVVHRTKGTLNCINFNLWGSSFDISKGGKFLLMITPKKKLGLFLETDKRSLQNLQTNGKYC